MPRPNYAKVGATLTKAAELVELFEEQWAMAAINLAITGDRYGSTSSQSDEYLISACGAVVAKRCLSELTHEGISLFEGEEGKSPFIQPAYKWQLTLQGGSVANAAALLRRCADDALYLAESGVTL